MAATELLRDLPVTARGVRTRASLVAAARTVFERAGYLDARLTDITKEANCSTGTFYTYFDNKEQIFAAVLEVAQEDMLHPGMGRVRDADNPYAVLESSNRAYLTAFQRNAKLMGLLEQVAQIDPTFAKLRRDRGATFITRNAKAIERLQTEGKADTSLDPLLASRALSSMVSRFAYSVFVSEEPGSDGKPVPFEEVVKTATQIWANALRLQR
ncbi:TetR/AcrR family transcriptional regulator [Rhodococcus globerulus]|uniref:TetR/AcrR family transcriptional regulator n=1 Tax=Rhodococcus globerulus TaxID=33008 RepID=A0ABU4BWR7_RHOGO|nr:TetR/AcrR family transcriptional regulator [Rhodococcus globerulus]MDV6268671.1 TetR/AcrR family transcriptional regulator [Rhodococcus globerulus]